MDNGASNKTTATQNRLCYRRWLREDHPQIPRTTVWRNIQIQRSINNSQNASTFDWDNNEDIDMSRGIDMSDNEVDNGIELVCIKQLSYIITRCKISHLRNKSAVAFKKLEEFIITIKSLSRAEMKYLVCQILNFHTVCFGHVVEL